MGSKLHELESWGYDLVGITEMWWDVSYDWSVAMEGYRVFRKHRMRRHGRGVAFHVREQLDCMKLCPRMDEESMESLWVRTKDRTGKDYIVVCVSYRPPDQEEQLDEAFYRQRGGASHLQALTLMGDSNHHNTCWKDNTAGHEESRRFLECVHYNFLLQVTEESRRKCSLLHLILTNNKGLTGDVKIRGSDHEMLEFRILRAGRRGKSKPTAPDFSRAHFGLLKDLLGRILWERPGGKGCLRKLINIQGSHPPRSRVFHLKKIEVSRKCQEACMVEGGAHSQTQTKKGNVQSVEERMGKLEGIRRNYLSIQG